MSYHTINRKRFDFLLRFGLDEGELKQFFIDNKALLILNGAKVQNLPRNPQEARATLLKLPPTADSLIQKWFSTNVNLINPEPVESLIDTFQLYEDLSESLPLDEAKRLSRSCLVHLFSDQASEELINFLKSPLSGDKAEKAHPIPAKNAIQASKTIEVLGNSQFSETDFANAVVALFENKNPEEYLSGLPGTFASFIQGLYAINIEALEEAELLIQELEGLDQMQSILSEYAERVSKAKESSRPIPSGLQIVRFEENEEFEFDFTYDKVLGKCTKDFPETAVFIQPFAIRTRNGELVSLENQKIRERLFPNSGDIQAFSGRNFPKQPSKDEIGLWHIAQNEGYGTPHRTNFHLTSSKTEIYEVLPVPFPERNYDSVREFIKQSMVARSGIKHSEPLLFVLENGLIVGCPFGKDLTKDEGFDDGLSCWRELKAFRFEGRLLVLGPLPASEKYECATLASALKKFISSKKTDIEKLTKAQQKYLLDSISSNNAHLNSLVKARLIEEIQFIESHDDAISLVIDEAMKHEKVKRRIEVLIHEKVNELTNEKLTLINEIQTLERKRAELKESVAKQEKERRAIPAVISKTINDAVKKAADDAMGTLGQVTVFKTLMEERGASSQAIVKLDKDTSPSSKFRSLEPDSINLIEAFKSYGLSAKHAHALKLTGEVVFNSGLILLIDGIASRLAAESWGRSEPSGCMLMDCTIGQSDDEQFSQILSNEICCVIIQDANISTPEVYARPLIDNVKRRIIKESDRKSPIVIMSLADGLASLPLPRSLEALAIRISLDDKPNFTSVEDLNSTIENLKQGELVDDWAMKLWPPALSSFIKCIENLTEGEAALVLSMLRSNTE